MDLLLSILFWVVVLVVAFVLLRFVFRVGMRMLGCVMGAIVVIGGAIVLAILIF
jgi:hypothetical protein